MEAPLRNRIGVCGPVARLRAPTLNAIVRCVFGGFAMRKALTAATALGGSLVLATAALAQAQLQQNTGIAAGAPSGQQSSQVVLPSVFQFVTRRAGIGAGGFAQLCDDPLDPRLITGECSAASIAQ